MHWLNPRSWGYTLAICLLMVSLQPAHAQLVSVSVAGVDTLMDTVKYGLKMAGKEDMAQQIDSLLDAFLQNEGFKGLNTKRGMGLYLNKFPSNPTQPSFVAYVPISNVDEFLALLGKLNVTPSKEENGVRSIQLPTGQSLYLKFKNDYAFISMDEDELKNTSEPDRLTSSVPANALIHVHVKLNEIPRDLKDKFLIEVAKGIEKEKGKKAGESDVEYQARLVAMNMPKQAIEQLVNGAETFSFSASLDTTKHVFKIDSILKAKDGSPLQQEMQAMNQSKSRFTSLLTSAPVSFVYHGVLNETVRKDFDKLLDNLVTKAIQEEKSVVKKAIAEKVYQVIEPTLKSKNYEFAFSMNSHGESEPMTGLAALRVKNGKQIEELIKGFVVELKEKERHAIKLDVENVDGVNLHTVTIPTDDKGAKEMTEVFGEGKLTLAFHDEAILLGIGKQSTEEVKRLLGSFNQAGANNPASMEFNLHARAFARFIKEKPVRKAFESAFTTPDSDLIKSSISGGDQLRFQLQVSTHFIKLAEAMNKGRDE